MGRVELDKYYTPEAVARACVGVLDLRGVAYVLEPSVGGGAWVSALRGVTDANVTGIDLDPTAAGLQVVDRGIVGSFVGDEDTDVLSPETSGRYDLVVGNPPFGDAEAHVRRALELGHTVAFLLRLAFLEGAKRRDFWQEHPAAQVHVLVSRPSFTGGGTDSAAYAFFVWHRGFKGPTTVHHLDWRSE